MRIILYGLWLITILAGAILGTIVPPSAVYLYRFYDRESLFNTLTFCLSI